MTRKCRFMIVPAAVSALVLLASLVVAGLVTATHDSTGPHKTVLSVMEPRYNSTTGMATVTARLTDAQQPVGGKMVEFFLATDFFGKQHVSMGTATTDTTGSASIRYEPRWQGAHNFTVRFQGDPGYAPSQTAVTFNMMEPVPVYEPEALGLGPVMQWVPVAVGAGVLAVWGILLLVIWRTVGGILRAGRRGLRPVPETARRFSEPFARNIS